MKTMTQQTMQMQQSNQSLIGEAFLVLLAHLGPEKTAQVWQVFTASYGDYLTIRPTVFAGMDATTMEREIRKFHRE